MEIINIFELPPPTDDPKLQKKGVHFTTTARGRKHHLPSYLKGKILVSWRVTLRLNVGEACWRFR